MRGLRIVLPITVVGWASIVLLGSLGARAPATASVPLELFAWDMVGPGSFSIERDAKDGSTYLRTHGGMGLLWFKGKRFADFRLTLQYRVNKESANSGIFVRFPRPYRSDGRGDPWIAVRQGYEIQIDDKRDPKHRTGSIYGYWPAGEPRTKPAGRWNTMEITVVGRRYTASVNGKPILDYDESKDPRDKAKDPIRPLEGYVGLQNHDDGSVVDFRNIRIVEIR